MPTYDYRCKACGHTFEELQTFSEPPLTKCPACKKNKLERLFGGGGAIIFKGSGFYETDYRRAGDGKAESKPDSNTAQTETQSETAPSKTEAAPSPASSDASAASSSTASASKSGGGKKAK